MLLSSVNFWQVNGLNERVNEPPLLAIQKRNKALMNFWHGNLVCINLWQRFLQSLPSSSRVSFLKTQLRPNNGTFIHGDNVIQWNLSVYWLVHFYFNFLKKAIANPQLNTWILPTYLFYYILYTPSGRRKCHLLSPEFKKKKGNLERMSETHVMLKIYY